MAVVTIGVNKVFKIAEHGAEAFGNVGKMRDGGSTGPSTTGSGQSDELGADPVNHLVPSMFGRAGVAEELGIVIPRFGIVQRGVDAVGSTVGVVFVVFALMGLASAFARFG